MFAWHADWTWGVPLIVLNLVIHVVGLSVVNERIVQVLSPRLRRRRYTAPFALVMGAAALVVTVLHAFEASVWAAAYRLLDALPDYRSAMLYSLGAITSYGHAPIFLDPAWQMLGALEALNGMMLFGLTTAFLFKMIQQVWPLGSRVRGAGISRPRPTVYQGDIDRDIRVKDDKPSSLHR